MDSRTFYRLIGPTEWCEPPTSFSFSSLRSIENCPLQWMLCNSSYGDLRKFPARPNPAGVEGQIVHEVTEGVLRRLAAAGFPALGTPLFRQSVADCAPRARVGEMMAAHQARIADHPRGSGFRLSSTTQAVLNKCIRQLRAIYPQVSHLGSRPASSLGTATRGSPPFPRGAAADAYVREGRVLTEFRLEHPALPFAGVLDLAWSDSDGVVLSELKVGKAREEHLDQVRLYALLWWRCVGNPPNRLEVRYANELVSLTISEEELEATEKSLAERLRNASAELASRPPRCGLGEWCRYCDVRQFCDSYWQGRQLPDEKRCRHAADTQWMDMEMRVCGEVSPSGFEGITSGGETASVVFAEDAGALVGPVEPGETIRVIGGVFDPKLAALTLLPRSEVFHRAPA